MSVLDNFSVIEVPRTFSIAEAKILKNRVSFNLMTAAELSYPAFVRFYISDDRTQFALQPCSKDTSNAVKFFTQDVSSKKVKAIAVCNQKLALLLKSGMGWNPDETFHVKGVRFAEENVLIFDLKQGYRKGDKTVAANGLCLIPDTHHQYHEIPMRLLSSRALPPPIIDAEVINDEGAVRPCAGEFER